MLARVANIDGVMRPEVSESQGRMEHAMPKAASNCLNWGRGWVLVGLLGVFALLGRGAVLAQAAHGASLTTAGRHLDFALTGPEQAPPPPMIGMGDSLGEGVQSADASGRTQPFGYLQWVARQMGVPFPLPLIHSGPFGVVGEATNRSRLDPALLAANLAVSGADIHALLHERADGRSDSETDLVLSPRLGSQIEIAESLRSPFTICWIGNNDVLGAILAFDHLDASQLTPVPQFAADFAEVVQRLSRWGGHVVLANIPDVSQIGWLFNRQDLRRFVGADFGLPEGSYTTLPTMLLIKTGLNDGRLLHDPNFVLDAQEVQRIQQRLEMFNRIIALNAAQAGLPVVDVNGLLKAVAAHPPVILGVTITTRYLGGFFSLDGVHPSNFGHAVIANAFIHTANAHFNRQIPPLSVGELIHIFVTDPFVDWDGDLKVRGRPRAGLLETLGPFLGISGDRELPGKRRPAPTIDQMLGQQFMRHYLALIGKDPHTPWDLQDAIEALRHVFGLKK